MTEQPTSRLQRQRERVKRLPRHPFIVPVITFFVLFMLSAAVFVVAGAQTVRPTDSHIVRLHVDGTSQTLPSRAATVGELLDRAGIQLDEYDVVEPGRDAVITDDNFDINVYRAHPVTVIEQTNQGPKTIATTYSAQENPADIARQVGVKLQPEDKVALAPVNDVLEEGISQRVIIERAVPVKLNLYGTMYDVRTHSKTVGELMQEREIEYDPSSVLPAADTPITPNMVVFVTSPDKQIAMVEEAIPAGEEIVQDPNLPLGQTQTRREGVPGKKVVVYEVAPDGGRTPLQEIVVIEPISRQIARGTKVVETRIAGDKSAILSAAGVPASQHFAADFIIARESGWNLAARNAGGCLGLGQACPGQKLVSACPNWQSDATCQIQFFSGYANSRYGSWQGAYEAWLIKHWW